MHKKEANKAILKVGFVVLAVIILVAILFSVVPRDGAVVGQAVLTGNDASVPSGGYSPTEGGDSEHIVVSVIGSDISFGGEALLTESTTDYVLLNHKDPPNSNNVYVCPSGNFDPVPGVDYLCEDNFGIRIAGWVIVDPNVNFPNVDSLRVIADNKRDHGNNVNPTGILVYVTSNLDGSNTQWVLANEGMVILNPTDPNVAPRSFLMNFNNLAVDAILLARSNHLRDRPDPRIYSVNVIEGCAPDGIVDSANDRICQGGIWQAGLFCTTENQVHPDDLAYCKKISDGVLKWSPGVPVNTRVAGANGVLIGTSPVSSVCQSDSFCVSLQLAVASTNYQCNPEDTLDDLWVDIGGTITEISSVCSNKKLYLCNDDQRDQGRIIPPSGTGEFVCLGTGVQGSAGNTLTWQEGIECQTEGQVNGQAICVSVPGSRGRSTLEWKNCDSISDTVCIDNQAEVCNSVLENRRSSDNEYYCSSGSWVKCNVDRLGQGVDNHAPTYQNTYVCTYERPNYVWQETTCGPPGRPSNLPGPSCAAGGDGACIGSSILNASNGQVLGTISSLVGHYAVNYSTTFVGCTTLDGCYYDDGNPSNSNYYEIDDITEELDLDWNEDDDFSGPNEGDGIELVCGRNNAWLRCLSGQGSDPGSTGATFIPSDGGRYICDSTGNDPEWLDCNNPTLRGTSLGGFECTQVLGEWKWFSPFACSPSSKYVVRTSGSSSPEICDGAETNSRYVACDEVDEIFNTPGENQYNEFVTVTCAQRNGDDYIFVNETGALACYNNNPIDNGDDDRDGAVNCDDSDCNIVQDYDVTSLFNSRGKNNTMVRLAVNHCAGVNLDLAGPAEFRNLRLCDTGTTSVATHATICWDATTGQQRQVPSVEFFSRDERSLPMEINGLTFIYFQPTGTDEKRVDVFNASLDLFDHQINYSLSEIASPFVNGQNLLFKMGRDYFLATYPESETLFAVDNIILKDLRAGVDYNAERFPGTNDFVFNVRGNRRIVMGIEDGKLKVWSELSEEGIAIPTQFLERNFEMQVTKRVPRFISELGSTLSVCRIDLDSDLDQVELCVNGTNIKTLQRNYLTQLEILQDEISYAFLYEFNGSDKVISIFNITNLDEVEVNGLSEDRFEYANYITSLIAGRRVAIKFEDQLYLAMHDVSNFFSQQDVSLLGYIDDQITTFPASGSEALAEYSLFGGKISIARNYGNVPPLPFRINGKSTDAILREDFDLREEFSTVMSSVQRVGITAPENFGIISNSSEGVNQDGDLYRLEDRLVLSGSTSDYGRNFAQINLGGVYESDPFSTDTSSSEGKALFYYHSATPIGTSRNPSLLKSVAIYLLYEVTGAGDWHIFNNDFIDTFTSGREIALQYGNQAGTDIEDQTYYLLSYQGATGNSAQSFTIRNLRLKTLDGSRTFMPNVDGLKASFDVPEGQMNVELLIERTGVDTITFSKTDKSALETSTFSNADYMIPINITHVVSSADYIVPVSLEICNENVHRGLRSANICYKRGGSTVGDLIVEEPKLLTLDPDVNPATSTLGNNNQDFILEINGRTGNSKQVFMRRIINLTANDLVAGSPHLDARTYDIERWSLFADNVSTGFGPVFNINGVLYLPLLTGRNLSMFKFGKYPNAASGETYSIRAPLERFSSVEFGGNITVGSDIITIRQELDKTTREDQFVKTKMTFIDGYKYLPDDRSELQFNVTRADVISTGTTKDFSFANVLNTKVYTLSISNPGDGSNLGIPSTINLRLQDDLGNTYLLRNFAAGDSRRLYLGNGFVEVKVKNLAYGMPAGCTNPQSCFVHSDITIKRG